MFPLFDTIDYTNNTYPHNPPLTVGFVSFLTFEHHQQMLLLQIRLFSNDGTNGGQRVTGLPDGPDVGLSAHMLPVIIGSRAGHTFRTCGEELDVEGSATAGGYLCIAVVDDDQGILVLAH